MNEHEIEVVEEARRELVEEADRLLDQLRTRPDDALLTDATAKLKPLRDAREFERLGALAEAISRRRRRDPMVKRLLAQSLIDRGMPTIAIDVLEATLSGLVAGDDANGERDELIGLIGRANKQIFMESSDASSAEAEVALRRSVEAYRDAYQRDPAKNHWHGVNLCAVLHAARRRGIRLFAELDGEAVARRVHAALLSKSAAERASDEWWSASVAETHLALGEWPEALAAIQDYVSTTLVKPFNLASTLRQFRDVWEIQKDSETGAAIVQLLEAKLLSAGGSLSPLPYPFLSLTPSHIRETLAKEVPEELEARLGDVSAVTLRWYRTGLERASSVAAIRFKLGRRIGSGFAVRAGDFGMTPQDAVLVLTNFHVVNSTGALGAATPSRAEVAFEAAGAAGASLPAVAIRKLLAESPFEGGLDYALLWLEEMPTGVKAVPFARELPALDPRQLVYIIGHPLGEELHISLQDNALIDHEGPPNGTPQQPGRIRVHYHAPTEKGSSGSPVFDENWETIALHHAGLKYVPAPPKEQGMERLNKKPGLYAANEGYWIGSVIADIRARNITLPSP